MTEDDLQRPRRRRRGGPGGGGRGAGQRLPGLSEQRRVYLETVVLIALLEEARHGYALIERARELLEDQLFVDPGSVYRVLRGLEEAGMVTSSWEAGEAGPQRRTYSIEAPGRALLADWADLLASRAESLTKLARLAREGLK